MAHAAPDWVSVRTLPYLRPMGATACGKRRQNPSSPPRCWPENKGPSTRQSQPSVAVRAVLSGALGAALGTQTGQHSDQKPPALCRATPQARDSGHHHQPTNFSPNLSQRRIPQGLEVLMIVGSWEATERHTRIAQGEDRKPVGGQQEPSNPRYCTAARPELRPAEERRPHRLPWPSPTI